VVRAIERGFRSIPSISDHQIVEGVIVSGDACSVEPENCGGSGHAEGAKYTVKGVPQSLPLDGVFSESVNTTGFMIVFNDDLDNAKPTTMSVAFSGTFK
jgi:hypothetical protein